MTMTLTRHRFEPHYRRIDRSNEVQIYESIMGDASGGRDHGTAGMRWGI